MYLLTVLQGRLPTNLFEGSKSDPKTVFFIVGGFLAFLVIMFVLSNYFNHMEGGTSRLNKLTFRKKARELGLNKNQIKLMLTLVKMYEVKKPLLLLSRSDMLNKLLKKAISRIRSSHMAKQQRENQVIALYRIKHFLEKVHKSSSVRNTHELKTGTKVIMERDDKKAFSSSIIGNFDKFFCVKLPKDNMGNEVRWKKGSRIKLITINSMNKEAVFISKTLGYHFMGDVNALIIAHTIKTGHELKRNFKRKSTTTSTYVYPVRHLLQPGNKAKKAIVEKKSARLGKFIDISSGGCAITMRDPFYSGSYVQLEFNLDKSTDLIMVQGKILSNRTDSSGNRILHIIFTRATASNLNKINNFIYELG